MYYRKESQISEIRIAHPELLEDKKEREIKRDHQTIRM